MSRAAEIGLEKGLDKRKLGLIEELVRNTKTDGSGDIWGLGMTNGERTIENNLGLGCTKPGIMYFGKERCSLNHSDKSPSRIRPALNQMKRFLLLLPFQLCMATTEVFQNSILRYPETAIQVNNKYLTSRQGFLMRTQTFFYFQLTSSLCSPIKVRLPQIIPIMISGNGRRQGTMP